ncbi:hypothetical protein M422DRAFT_33795 [Sphaerobolus stellatus SS14]|uniref:DUF590-domain-containing protein n=1 Tax=Sphaerobolus stellatus (strain SS14) TaxID=990650 RepID=A0A0C9VJG2_SPHS4|nr:hypothetical protein M422DRAFT_33795 [Sphaerobolus stellatus SS14]
MPPAIDLVLVFDAEQGRALSKQQALDNARRADTQYTRLLTSLRDAGFKVTGRRGEKRGQILVLLWTPPRKLAQLISAQLHDDFLLGLPSSTLPGQVRDFVETPLSAADRIRVVYTHITSLKSEGGLAIIPGVEEWSYLKSILSLHDDEFNKHWISNWTHRVRGIHLPHQELTKIRDEFGEAIAMYFGFLSAYTQSLVIPSALGIIFWFTGRAYSPVYSFLLSLWSLCWVEWWRIQEKALSVRWGTLGSFRTEKRRAQFRGEQGKSNEEPVEQAFPWWKREARVLASVPIILAFSVVLAALLTAIFVFEAFVTQLYRGPLHDYISFAPTVLFIALVPRVLGVYQAFARRLTNWENHAHQSSHDASLTIKTFALSAIVAYLGLALSAFIYVPFGPFLMTHVHNFISKNQENISEKQLFATDVKAQAKIDPSRLQNQMFAYTVTNQVINTLIEVVLPYVLRGINDVRNGKHPISGNGNGNGNGKKKVGFKDNTVDDKEERQFLSEVRRNVSLPEYELFGDYAEMVTQFGYVTLWSTIWPLGPLMALLNNWLELRSDAFKITVHSRRPIPVRVETIGPWLDSMAFISWLSAVTNTALVSLFRPEVSSTSSARFGTALNIPSSPTTLSAFASPFDTYRNLLAPSLLLALAASYGFLLLRGAIRHIMDKAVWKGSEEERMLKRAREEVVKAYLAKVKDEDVMDDVKIAQMAQGAQDGNAGEDGFWSFDEGKAELEQDIKMT